MAEIPQATIRSLVEAWTQNPDLEGQLGRVYSREPTAASFQEWPDFLLPSVQEVLRKGGCSRGYAHQVEAVEAWGQGKDVALSTGTGSGKSLAYQIAALQCLSSEPAARALFLYPTKALSQDQLGKLEALLPSGYYAGVYDGDTAKSRRSAIRNTAHVVLSNPDMLHVGILPGHEGWIRFLRSLRLIVIDEMHVYRGAFGSHTAGILRRLLRLCAWHGSRPQVFCASATVAEPEALAEKLVGRPFHCVERDRSAKAGKTYLFWNPPLTEDGEPGSANYTSASLVSELAGQGVRSLCFSRSRVGAELVLRYARERAPTEIASRIESYRGGYTPKERRALEKALFSGQLLGLSATNALELGIDVGGLDAVILNGYPGSVASFWQQTGRSGRGDQEGLAIFVPRNDPLDQFFFRSPALLLDGTPEPVALYPENPFILAQQLRCAAYERPIAVHELDRFGGSALEVAEQMEQAGDLSFRGGLFYLPTHTSPAPSVNIRGSGSGSVRLLLDGTEFGQMDRSRALREAHKGAIYLHRGATYLVEDLDLGAGAASLRPESGTYYTRAISQSLLEVGVELNLKATGVATLILCGATVSDSVVGYRKLSADTGKLLGTEPLELPVENFQTVAVQIDLPIIEDSETAVMGVHAAEHALLTVAPWIAGCDRGDLGSAWYAVHHQSLRPAVFLFDRTPGGVGLSDQLFERADEWIREALRLLTSCPCEFGCPSCLLISSCESANEYLSKREGVAVLRALNTLPE